MHVTGIKNREYLIVENLTLKERNAERKRLEADGWTITTHGNNRSGWELRAWKGEAPLMVQERFDLRNGGHTTTPHYRAADYETTHNLETIDGKPR